MNHSVKYTTTAFMVFSVFLVVVAGAYWVYSPVVEEVVTDYGLTLDAQSSGRGVTLSGTLTDNGSPISGATMHFYHTDDVGTILDEIIPIATVTTDSNGDYSYWFLESSTGTYYYMTGYDAV